MQKIFRAVALCLSCLVLVLASGSPTGAIDVLPTPATEFSTTPPLMITGYQTMNGASALLAVEVYNAGDVPLDLSNWTQDVITKDSTVHTLTTTTSYKGMLLPGEHATYAVAGSTTYALIYESYLSPITSIEFHYVGKDTAYGVSTASIKDMFDLPLFRTYTSTGYSTATQPFSSTPARSFYDDGLYLPPVAPDGLQIVEMYPYASDCAPFDQSILCGDYVKLYNASDHDVPLDNFVLRTDSSSSSRTSSNTVTLTGSIAPRAVTSVAFLDNGGRLSLTNTGGYVWLEDAWGLARYDTTMAHYVSVGTSQQGYAYALAVDGTWQWTTTPEPASTNVITAPVIDVAVCPEGKYRNPDTGRCRTLEETVNALAVCEEGYERNLDTNRCRKITTTAVATLTPCLEGQERNPATNRCRSIASAVAELIPCDEGYERNPDTNRCRKIQTAAMPLASYPVQPVTEIKGDSAGMIALATVATVAVGYIIWEWRREIVRILRGAVGFLTHGK